MHRPEGSPSAKLRLLFDELPETREAVSQFKGFILAMRDNPQINRAGWTLAREDISEFRSHEHVLAQCLDVVLGSITFRLNDKHKLIPAGEKRRGKRTVAKEALYKSILHEIHRIRPGLNIGISTGLAGDVEEKWNAPYLHWRFVPAEVEIRGEFTKPKKKNGPTRPT